MPDSQQPPFWGPPYDDRDLDALLSGETGSTPEALLPVECTLDALRATATGRELSDEAAARAAFRALAPPRVPWTAQAKHGTVTPHRLVLPPADGRTSRPHRHRRRRRASGDGRRPAIALVGVAAAAVVVIAVAFTGAIPSSIGNLVSSGHHHASSASPKAQTGQTPGALEGTAGASEPTPSPEVTGTVPVSPSASATAATGTLCREFFEHYTEQTRATRHALLQDLERVAGNRLSTVLNYCVRYMDSAPYSRVPHPPMTFPTTLQTGGHPGAPGIRGKSYPKRGAAGDSGTAVPSPAAGQRTPDATDQTPDTVSPAPAPDTATKSPSSKSGAGQVERGPSGLGGARG